MSKSVKHIFIAVLIVFTLAIVFLKTSDYLITKKLNNHLKNNLPQSVNLEYGHLEVSSWHGNVTLLNVKIAKSGKTSHNKYIEASIDTISIEGISYWDYFIHGKVSIDNIKISRPKVEYNHNELVASKSYQVPKKVNLEKQIEIEHFNITHGHIAVRNTQTDSVMLQVENVNADIQHITLNDSLLSEKIPFNLKKYALDFETFFYQLNAFENVTVKASKIDDTGMQFTDFHMKTKYSKEMLSTYITTERDFVDVYIDSIKMSSQDFGFKHDSVFFFHVPKTVIYDAKAIIYRDKLVADDLTIKPLYGKMLKVLDFDLTLNNVEVLNANINYYERAKADNSGGEISFSRFNATLKNVSNTYKTPQKTTIAIETNFMKTTPLKINWSFDVNDVSESFLFSGDLGMFQTQGINKFSEPNLNMRFSGEILKTYFTISGNTNSAIVDLKTKYQDFDIIALRKDGKRKNKLISSILNVLVFNNSKDDSENFRVATKVEVERDKTKSVFNYIWLNVKAGLREAMTSKSKSN